MWRGKGGKGKMNNKVPPIVNKVRKGRGRKKLRPPVRCGEDMPQRLSFG